MCSSFQQLWDDDDDCYLLEHPTCCLVHKNCFIIILVEVKPNLNHYSESDNVLSHITEISRGGTTSWFIWRGCWEKSVIFSQFSLSLSRPLSSPPPPMTFCDSLFLLLILSVFVSASLFLSLFLCLPFLSLKTCLPFSFLSLCLSFCLYLSASLDLSLFSLSPCPLSPASTPPCVSSLSLLLSVFLGLSLCHLIYPVSLSPTFLFVGYNSWQPRVSGWPLTVCMEISAGDPIKKRIVLLPHLQQKPIYPDPPRSKWSPVLHRSGARSFVPPRSLGLKMNCVWQ